MTDQAFAGRYYWERFTEGDGVWTAKHPHGPPGDELAGLRQGIGQEPGAAPGMWRFYTTLDSAGDVTEALWAEHVALTLYAVHQQSKEFPVHQSNVGIGKALLALRQSGRYKEPANGLDRRFAAAATATSIGEVAVQLRGLVTKLRDVGQGLDYTQLFDDLKSWQVPERMGEVRRRWGAQYFNWSRDAEEDFPKEPSAAPGVLS